MKLMEWGWGEEAAREFTGVPPVKVDIHSQGWLSLSARQDASAGA